jgi:diguanylate cyclase
MNAPTRAAPTRAAELSPAELAKAALRRLVMERQEPTPENYQRAYRAEAGEEPVAEERPAAAGDDAGTQAHAWAALIERVVRGVERGGRNWTAARKKDSLQRVLAGSRSDPAKLQQRLQQLIGSWDTDTADDRSVETSPSAPAPMSATDFGALLETPAAGAAPPAAEAPPLTTISLEPQVDVGAWSRIVQDLGATVQCALPTTEVRGREAADVLRALTDKLKPPGAAHAALASEVAEACAQAQRVLQHRHHLVAQLGVLCYELTEGLTDLAEDDSWVRGQCDAMRTQLGDGLTARSVRSVGDLLHGTRMRQQQLRIERAQAREALKLSINRMLQEIAELGTHTGRFQDSVVRYADVIESADSLESLAGVVREMVEETRTVHGVVSQTQERLQAEHTMAEQMSERVRQLEAELKRLSDEVSTDQLTQVANRRGMLQAFEVERSRVERAGSDGSGSLAVGLIDVDDFKKLNDQFGHTTGDEALKFLAQRVKQALRPSDTLARYGGEEFVVLLPDTPVTEAQQVLTRLQRALSAELFMHENKQTFVTFSAGVTVFRLGERVEETLDRADEALYEAKRTGKNRTCIA